MQKIGPLVGTAFLHPQNYPSWYDLIQHVESNINPQNQSNQASLYVTGFWFPFNGHYQHCFVKQVKNKDFAF